MEGQILVVLMGALGDITVDPDERLKGGHNILRIEGMQHGGVTLRQNIWDGPERTVIGVRYAKDGDLKRISMTRKHADARYARTRVFVDKRFSPDEPFEASFQAQRDKKPVYGDLFTPAPNQGPSRDLILREGSMVEVTKIETVFENLPVHVTPQEVIAFVMRYCDKILPKSIHVPFADLGFEGLRIQAELAAREAEKSEKP